MPLGTPKQEETTLAKVGVEKLKMDIIRAKPFFREIDSKWWEDFFNEINNGKHFLYILGNFFW